MLACFNKNKVLYHGSHKGIIGDIKCDYVENRQQIDFGRGFYTGNIKSQAESLICDDNDGKFYTILWDEDTELSSYTFKDNLLWALFIAVNRGKINVNNYPKLKKLVSDINSYDIIIGPIADDQIATTYTKFLQNSVSDVGLIQCMKYLNLGDQYVFKTQKACNSLIIDSESTLSEIIKRLRRREKNDSFNGMTSKINEITSTTIRQGALFSEALEQYI